MAEYSTYDIVALLISVLLPPLGVFMKRGFHIDFWINILLTILGWLPGLFHAFFIIYEYRNDSTHEHGKHGHGTHGTTYGTHGTHGKQGTRPQKIIIHSNDNVPMSNNNNNQNQPQYYQSQDQPNYQPQYQQQRTRPMDKDKGKDPFHDDNYAGTSNEIPPAYGDHKNDELKGESNQYDRDDKKV
ncbi:hypothetical protein RclHR1_00410021 [Rhizophagus clarus]|uniref:Plasma membrane proteolipid 3 n=1 Tax=Rhizophagus clarus TaxID=94130 RepID=A0A2Z6RGK2_9GLOM|nr:hypothetical protein RclHR1_00410021 [Rhizophagus clarus]GES78933.1 plasma membrane proteolipid 3 [Rhizophagus clarus]